MSPVLSLLSQFNITVAAAAAAAAAAMLLLLLVIPTIEIADCQV